MPDQKTPKSPPWLKRLGNRIRQARRIRGLTQTDVARPNLTKSFISLLESGRTYPSVGTLVALADRLQTSLGLLLLETPQLPRETALNLFTLARTMAEAAPADAERLLAAGEVLAAGADDLGADLLLTRADIALVQGKMKDAERFCEEALAWARKRHLGAYEPRALARLAAIALHQGTAAAARERLEAALSEFRATRTLRSVEGCETMLAYGDILSQQGKTARALRLLEEVVQVAQRQELPLILGRAHAAIGRVEMASGHAQKAREALQHARSALEEAPESSESAQALRSLGVLLHESGALQEAHTILQHALRIQERLGESRHRGVTLNELARVLVRLGKAGEAQASAKAALEIAEARHDLPQKARVLVTMAQIAKVQRRWKQTTDLFREATDLFKKSKMTAELSETARELGMLLKERGEHAEAADYLAMAITAERTERSTRH